MSRRTLVTVLLVLGVRGAVRRPAAARRRRLGLRRHRRPGHRRPSRERPATTPWFDSVLLAASAEVESGLFALQAALGGGVLGYVIGRLRGRRGQQRAGRGTRRAAVTGLAVDDAAWASAWRRRSPGDKLLLCVGLVVCALVLPAWPGSVLVGAVAVALALGPARVPAADLRPGGALAAGLRRRRRADRGGLGATAASAGRPTPPPAPARWSGTPWPAAPRCCCWPPRRRWPTCCPRCAGCGCPPPSSRSPSVDLPAAVRAAAEPARPSARRRPPGWATPRSAAPTAPPGVLAAAVLTRSWDRARRMQEGLAGRGLETGLRVLPEVLPSSRAVPRLLGARAWPASSRRRWRSA